MIQLPGIKCLRDYQKYFLQHTATKNLQHTAACSFRTLSNLVKSIDVLELQATCAYCSLGRTRALYKRRRLSRLVAEYLDFCAFVMTWVQIGQETNRGMFRRFSQFLQANAEMELYIRPLSLSFHVLSSYSFIILSFDVIQFDLLTASLSKP